ncbi:MAG: hypothetical protein JJ902_05205 [Roseibium sp.]|nr:hypothetical protein [Roseibium sp.]
MVGHETMTEGQDVVLRETAAELDVFEPIGVFDTERFEAVTRVANVMAQASLIPDALKGKSPEETFGNCFLVANQAAGWKMDPFAVAQCVSLVHGKLCYEGKLVAAVLRAQLRIELHYQFFGEQGTTGFGVIVSDTPANADGTYPPGARTVPGTVGEWQTFKRAEANKPAAPNDNWTKSPARQLRYRGAREWCRVYESRVMLGVYSEDEFDELDRFARSERARNVTPGDNPLVDSSKTEPSKGSGQEGRRPDTTSGKGAGTGGARPDQAASPGPGKATPDQKKLFEKFTAALLPMRGDNLSKARKAFWMEHPIPDAEKTDAIRELEAKIFEAHQNRDAGRLSITDCKSHVAELIEEVFSCSSS